MLRESIGGSSELFTGLLPHLNDTEEEPMNIQLDTAMQTLDANARQVIVDAAQAWAREKQNAAPTAVAPADAGRVGDEQHPAPVDVIRLLDTTTNEAYTVYEVEVSIAGTLDHLSVSIADDGSVQVQPAE